MSGSPDFRTTGKTSRVRCRRRRHPPRTAADQSSSLFSLGASPDLCSGGKTLQADLRIYTRISRDTTKATPNVVRDEFELMLKDLRAGLIDGIVAYDLDRLARQPRDLERLIEIFDERPKSEFATVTNDVNLGTPDGRTMARIMVAFANKSSHDASRRITRKHLELAQQGPPWWPAPRFRPRRNPPDSRDLVRPRSAHPAGRLCPPPHGHMTSKTPRRYRYACRRKSQGKGRTGRRKDRAEGGPRGPQANPRSERGRTGSTGHDAGRERAGQGLG
ncbi:recombinase family protein [Streptomyces sp. NPDC058293]|uniref:recombinase family protein n=1 Tax=Streptomyces sp. NPDC058293 TaxID=3346429 RepID=UPI0036E7FD75